MNRLQWTTQEHRERTLRSNRSDRTLKGITHRFKLIHFLNWTDEMLRDNERMFNEEYPQANKEQ